MELFAKKRTLPHCNPSGICPNSTFATERCGSLVVTLAEQLYKVRDVGKGALGTNLRHGTRGRNQHYFRSIEALLHSPTMGRGVEQPLELLFERRERAICQFGKRLHRHVVENIIVDNTHKLPRLGICRTQHLTSNTAILLGEKQIYKFVEFYALPNIVVKQPRTA